MPHPEIAQHFQHVGRPSSRNPGAFLCSARARKPLTVWSQVRELCPHLPAVGRTCPKEASCADGAIHDRLEDLMRRKPTMYPTCTLTQITVPTIDGFYQGKLILLHCQQQWYLIGALRFMI